MPRKNRRGSLRSAGKSAKAMQNILADCPEAQVYVGIGISQDSESLCFQILIPDGVCGFTIRIIMPKEQYFCCTLSLKSPFVTTPQSRLRSTAPLTRGAKAHFVFVYTQKRLPREGKPFFFTFFSSL